MHCASRWSGRVSVVLLAALCAVGFIVLLVSFTGQTPRAAAGQFMTALAKGDADGLADLSIVQTKSRDDMKKQWEDTVRHTRSYVFVWQILAVTQNGDNATVKLDVVRNATDPMSYAEHFELPLTKRDGKWKVLVPQISREMFPYLPQ